MFLTCYFYFVDSDLCISGKMDFNLFFMSFIFLWAQWVQNAFIDLNMLLFLCSRLCLLIIIPFDPESYM